MALLLHPQTKLAIGRPFYPLHLPWDMCLLKYCPGQNHYLSQRSVLALSSITIFGAGIFSDDDLSTLQGSGRSQNLVCYRHGFRGDLLHYGHTYVFHPAWLHSSRSSTGSDQ